MSITIVATAGSASANSFVTEVEQIAYMAARLNATDTWDTFTGSTLTENEKAALVEATRELTVRDWVGLRVDTTQILAWPRSLAIDPDSPTYSYFDTTEIPQRVKDACMELAFQFIKSGTTDVAAEDPRQNVIESTVDVLTTRFSEPQTRTKGLAKYPRVWNNIRPLLMAAGVNVPIVRG